MAALKRDGELVTNIFLRVDPMDEIGDGEKYRVILRFTALEEVLGQTEAAKRAIELTEFIQREFAAVGGSRSRIASWFLRTILAWLISRDDAMGLRLPQLQRGRPERSAPNTA